MGGKLALLRQMRPDSPLYSPVNKLLLKSPNLALDALSLFLPALSSADAAQCRARRLCAPPPDPTPPSLVEVPQKSANRAGGAAIARARLAKSGSISISTRHVPKSPGMMMTPSWLSAVLAALRTGPAPEVAVRITRNIALGRPAG